MCAREREKIDEIRSEKTDGSITYARYIHEGEDIECNPVHVMYMNFVLNWRVIPSPSLSLCVCVCVCVRLYF